AEQSCPECFKGFWSEVAGDEACVCRCGSAYHPACLLLRNASGGELCHAKPGDHSARPEDYRKIKRWADQKIGRQIDSNDLPLMNSLEQAKAEQQNCAEGLGIVPEWVNDLGMGFRLIPPGRFLMGASAGDRRAKANECPVR